MKVTVITVCYNAASTISDTICSVGAQDYPDVEHIIIDGASSDRTLDILRNCRSHKMHVVSGQDSGIYDAMNKGLHLATGELIGFLNADDFFCRTDVIGCLVRAAKNNPNAAAVAGGVAVVDPDVPAKIVRSYGSSNFRPWMLRFGHMPPHPGFYVRKDAAKQVGFFNEKFRIAADFDWMVRFFEVHRFCAVKLRETLVGLRTGGVSTRGLRSAVVINREAGISLAQHACASSPALIWSKYAFKAMQLFLQPRDYPAPKDVRWMPARAPRLDLG